MACGMQCSKGVKICSAITATIIILLVVTLVILIFTVFKPKEPNFTMHPVQIVGWQAKLWPPSSPQVNISLGIVATVKNRNRGSFTYEDSTTFVTYRGNVVGEGPIRGDTIPERGELNVSTTVKIFADKLLKDPNFLGDFVGGVLNFTSSSTLYGKVRILKIIKKKATSYSTCHISVFTRIRTANSTCYIKMKF